jgi:hypothetical protein
VDRLSFLNAGLARKTFWTFSVWEDQASLDTFAASDPHRAIIGRLRPRMSPTRFEFPGLRVRPAADMGADHRAGQLTGRRPRQSRNAASKAPAKYPGARVGD